MVLQVPFRARYELSRMQRLVPHVRVWGLFYTPFILLMLLFFGMGVVVNAGERDFCGVIVFSGFILLMLAGFRGLFVGWIDVLLVSVQHVDIEVGENAIAIRSGTEPAYLFLDGFFAPRKFRADVWTLEHFHGYVLNIAASAISEEQINYIRTARGRERTREDIRALIVRGQRISELLRARSDG
jgi:hypothetical protein